MRSSVSLASLGLFLAVIGVPSTSGQDGEDNKELTALLERPISPGALAMLIPHTREPRAVARWVTSLDHENPDVRSAAARLLLAASARSTASRLQQALTDERDAETALEMARALLVLGGPQADATVIGTGERLADGRLAVAYARA